MKNKELEEEIRKLNMNSNIVIDNMTMLEQESRRVANIAGNAENILQGLDAEFESQTELHGTDLAFLFLATGLQLARIFLINNLTKTEAAGKGNKIEDKLHNAQEKILQPFDNGTLDIPKPYYAPRNQIINGRGVPYDATGFVNERIKKEYSPFKGANHRFATLGHDPILGLIFGTCNILTNTITFSTKNNVPGMKCIPTIVYSNHVQYDQTLKNPRISLPASTIIALETVARRIINGDGGSVIAALIKQIIHIGTDIYTPCGIQIPGANLILSNTQAEQLTKYISAGDLIKVGTAYELATFINFIISTLHLLLFDESKNHSLDVYSVKTRKIILYSNCIASASNLLWVGANIAAGNETSIKDIDFGGLIVTVQRLLFDPEFIRQIKEEFVFGGFKQLIQGDGLNLQEVEV